MDKYAAREALKNKGFFEERHGMLMVRDNELIQRYQELLSCRAANASPQPTPASLATS